MQLQVRISRESLVADVARVIFILGMSLHVSFQSVPLDKLLATRFAGVRPLGFQIHPRFVFFLHPFLLPGVQPIVTFQRIPSHELLTAPGVLTYVKAFFGIVSFEVHYQDLLPRESVLADVADVVVSLEVFLQHVALQVEVSNEFSPATGQRTLDRALIVVVGAKMLIQVAHAVGLVSANVAHEIFFTRVSHRVTLKIDVAKKFFFAVVAGEGTLAGVAELVGRQVRGAVKDFRANLTLVRTSGSSAVGIEDFVALGGLTNGTPALDVALTVIRIHS